MRQLTAFIGFAVLSIASLLFVFSAGINLLSRWQLRSAPPRDEVPPTFVERLPETTFDLLVAALFFYFALSWVRMIMGPGKSIDTPSD